MFGAGPDSILPGGMPRAAPLGGGEFVPDRRSPSKGIEPHTMPRPIGSLSDPPVVRTTSTYPLAARACLCYCRHCAVEFLAWGIKLLTMPRPIIDLSTP